VSAIEALKADAKSKLDQASAIADLATREKRPLTKGEAARVEELLHDVASTKAQIQVARQREELTDTVDALEASWTQTKGLGDILLQAGLAQGPDGIASGKPRRQVEPPRRDPQLPDLRAQGPDHPRRQ
jgi:hypothetical protein